MGETTDGQAGNTGGTPELDRAAADSVCGSGCACHLPLNRPSKVLICLGLVMAAGVVLAHSLWKKNGSAADTPQPAFSAVQPQGDVNVPSAAKSLAKTKATESNKASLWGPALNSFASLNDLGADKDTVFVLVADKDKDPLPAVRDQVEAAARKLQAAGYKVGAFTFAKDCKDYRQLAGQVPLPCVLSMVKGRGASAVSGEITEGKLLQAFVAASRPASSCGPAGCGPAGCN